MATASTTRVGVRTTSRTPVVEEFIPNSGWAEDPSGHYLLVDLPEFRKEEVNLQVDSSGNVIVRGERKVNERKSVHFKLTYPVPEDSDADKITGKFDAGILYVTVPKRISKENKESEIQEASNGNAGRAEENQSQELNAGNEVRGPSQHDSLRENEEKRKENAHLGVEENQSQKLNAGNEVRDPNQHDSLRENEGRRNENSRVGEFSEQLIRKWEQEPMLRNAMEVLRKNKGIVITAVIAFSLGILVSRKFQLSSAP
ncbi:hypothetical protein RIF29_08017 [Crotalaria pallida]|uniref:SHSP domain-containing protein n=1 Tax=Crotalaria pallida TaxID=3830 RepID=A0AAN9J4R6_CROPI